MNIFCSTLTYALGKQLGIRAAVAELTRQISDPEPRDPGLLLPVSRVIHRLRHFGDVVVHHGSSTSLPKARSRAAHAALESGADIWVTVDDDVETDLETLARLITIVGDDRCAVLPCALRGTDDETQLLNLVWSSPLITSVKRGDATRGLPPEQRVEARGVTRGGCGLMIVAHAALARITEAYRSALEYDDDDGVKRVALFQPAFVLQFPTESRLWIGEDYSFCERLRACDVPIVAPVKGLSFHDGAVVDLAQCARLE